MSTDIDIEFTDDKPFVPDTLAPEMQPEMQPAMQPVKTSKLKYISKTARLILPADKCDKAIFALFFILFLLLLILVGIVLQEAKANKPLAWILYSINIILGLLALFTIIKGGKLKKYGLPILSILITVLNFTAMIAAKPDLSPRNLFTPHFANVTFAIVSVLAAVFTGSGISS